METLSVLLCDYYKMCHADQYDPRINKLVSYATPRGCRLPGKDYVINFGIQAFCKEFLIEHFNKNFFNLHRSRAEKEMRDFLTNTLPGVDIDKIVNRVLDLYDLGYLPISLRTVPEGGKLKLKCPNVELVTTNPDFAWVGGFIESLMSSDSWKPMIDATVGHWYRETANKYYEMTADDWQSKVRSAMSEFGFRGADRPESGICSGAAWLLSFNKTATCSAIPYINKYYNMRYPGSTFDITRYIMVYHNELMADGLRGKELDHELNSFMSETQSWHSTRTIDKETGKYVTALPLGWDNYPDWLIPMEIWDEKMDLLTINGELIVKVGKEEWTTIPIDEDVVGQGLISTEHSVMCSYTQMEIEELISERTDITEKLSKGFSSDKVKFKDNCLGSLALIIDDKINDPEFDKFIDDLEMKSYVKDPSTGKVFLIRYILSDKDYEVKDGRKSQICKFLSPCKLVDIQKEAEYNVVKRLLTEVYPHSSFSMVSDSYDYWRLVTEILPELKEDILSRGRDDGNAATLFVRGDSGDPVKIVAGYIDMTKNISVIGEIKPGTELPISDIPGINKSVILRKINGTPDNLVFNVGDYGCIKGTDGLYYKLKCNESGRYYIDDKIIPSYIAKGTVEVLWDIFGGTVNSKGYKVLDPHIRAIYGDSITQQRQEMIYKILELKGFSVENVALGAGSFSFHAYEKDGVLYPYTRDTMNYCMKNTYAEYSKEVKSTTTGNGLPSKSGIYGNSHIHTSIEKHQESVMVYKDPKTDNENFKRSQRGCCAVYKTETDKYGNYYYYLDHDGLTLEERESDTDIAFEEIFRDGKMIKEVTFKEVREILNNGKF